MDWEPGDLALCVDDSPAREIPLLPDGRGRENVPTENPVPLKKGKIYQVARVGPVRNLIWQGLSTTESPRAPWLVTRFIKVTPPSDMTLEETSTPKEVENAG